MAQDALNPTEPQTAPGTLLPFGTPAVNATTSFGDGSTQEDEITYVSGINADGTIAGRSFGTWNSTNTANGDGNYDTANSFAFKWNTNNTSSSLSSTAGSSGGTVSYYFDPAANWTAGEQTSLASGLDMWSAVANISFVQTNNANSANITFQRNTNQDAFFQSTNFTPATVGGTALYHPTTGSYITLDASATQDNGFGKIGDFTANGGYGVQVVLHEIGHSLGFGHGGPYNGNNTSNQQFSPYDNRAYTIMSYFNPGDPVSATNQANSNQYASPVTTNWMGHNATTWMPLDIDAMQRIYGAQNNGPLNTAQTFGYNTTVPGRLTPYFDFNTNTTPVVTIYDTAASGNRLDLSGTSAASTLDLNPGTYSSTHGMTNNLAIYRTTYIESAVLGGGNDRITMNTTKNNTVDGGAGTDTAVFSGNLANYTISQANGATTVTRNGGGPADTLTNFETLQFADQAVAVCFTTGTRIRTIRGEVAVEDLAVGDVTVTASGRLRPITWIGHRDIDAAGRTLPHDQQPIRIRQGAFGPGLPAHDLCLSPGHPVLVGAEADSEGGVLVPVMCLINGTTITREPATSVTYWHVELDAHDILLAEGLAAESYLDWGDRAFFMEASDHALHNPDFVVPGLSGRCRPVALDGALVEAERARLDAVFAAELAAHSAWGEADAWLAA